jgi:predicted phage tail protein
MSLRKNTLLATLKIHSAFSNRFDKLKYQVDAETYADFFPYLSSMHPKFREYMLQIETQESDESFCLLDDDLNIIDNEAIFIKRVKDGEVVHLVPAIVGGGGKRGGLLVMAAAMAFVVVTAGAGAPVAAGAGTAGAGASGFATGMGPAANAAAASKGFAAGSGGIFSGMSGMAMRLVGNIAMSILSRLFAPKPKATERDTSTRDNNMFGSLTNSTTSGTPIPLVYGQMRVGGQMLSGYLDAEIHGKSDIINVGDKFD